MDGTSGQSYNVSCHKCGTPLPENAPICPGCGIAFVTVCPRCQFANPITNTSCFSCHTPLNQDASAKNNINKMDVNNMTANTRFTAPVGAAAPQAGAPSPAPSPEEGGQSPIKKIIKNKLFIVGASVFLVLLILLIIMLPVYIDSKVPDQAKKYISFISAGNYDQAYDMLSNAAKKVIDKGAFSEFLAAQGAGGNVLSSLKEVSKTDNTAVLTFSVIDGLNREVKGDLLLVKEGSEWKISGKSWLLQRAKAALQNNNFDSATGAIERLKQIDPEDPRLYFYQCAVSASSYNFTNAIDSCALALTKNDTATIRLTDSERSNIAYYQALANLSLGNSDLALTKIDEALSTPDLTEEVACKLYGVKFDSLIAKNDYDLLRVNLESLPKTCESDDTKQMLEALNGQAKVSAVQMAQNHVVDDQMSGLNFARMLLSRDSVISKYTVKPEVVWTATYEEGPFYNVSVIARKGQVRNRAIPNKRYLAFRVNAVNGNVVVTNTITEKQMADLLRPAPAARNTARRR